MKQMQTHDEHKNAKKPNGPLRTLTEIAAEFGVHPNLLKNLFGTSPIKPPMPWGRPGRINYYELHAMRAWWHALDHSTSTQKERLSA